MRVEPLAGDETRKCILQLRLGNVDGIGQTIMTDAVQGNGIVHLALVGVRRQ